MPRLITGRFERDLAHIHSRDRAMMAQRFISAGLLRPEPIQDVLARIEKGLMNKDVKPGRAQVYRERYRASDWLSVWRSEHGRARIVESENSAARHHQRAALPSSQRSLSGYVYRIRGGEIQIVALAHFRARRRDMWQSQA